MQTDQEGRGRAVLWYVVVCNLHRQGDVLWAVGAAGADLCCEAFDAAWGGESALQHGLLRRTGQGEKCGQGGSLKTSFTVAHRVKLASESNKHMAVKSIKIHISFVYFNWNQSSVAHSYKAHIC